MTENINLPELPMGDDWAYSPGEVRAAQRAAVIADRAQRQAVPQGWKLVPVEPTKEMIAAVTKNYGMHPNGGGWPAHIANIWRKMICASPTPPASTEAQLPTAEPKGVQAQDTAGGNGAAK